MPRTIENTITNLQFIQQCLVCEIKDEPLPQSERTYKRALRSTLASLKILAKRHHTPELNVLADRIYEFTSPKPTSKWRKRMYFFFGTVFIVVVIGLVILTEGEILQAFHHDSGGNKEKSKENLKEALVRTQTAVDILKKIPG